MPRIVDHEARRAELVGAALRVITTEGFAAASVRRVAHEAGHSPGSLRHYFPRQERLIEAVLAEVTQVAAARLVPLVVALEGAGRDEVVDAACALLEGLLPLDATRATEWSVWSALVDPPAVPEGLERWRQAGWTGTRHHCRHVVRRPAEPEAAPAAAPSVSATGTPSRSPAVPSVPDAEQILAGTEGLAPLADPAAEARAGVLHAVVDGLSVQLMTQPGELSAAQARRVLRQAVVDVAGR